MMILAHMEGTGANKDELNGGKLLRRAVGMAGKGWQQAHSPQNKTTAGGHSQRILRSAQASKQTATDDRPCSETTAAATMLAGLSPCSAGRWGECSGVGTQEGGLRPT